MRSVRRHLVVAAALVLVLATGIALGAGPLSHDALFPTSAEPAAPRADGAEPVATADDLAEVVAPDVSRGALTTRGVALLATPGVDAAVTDRLAAGVQEAGGVVVARWQAGESLVSAGEKALVDTLGSQLLEQLQTRAANPAASAYERMGQLVGTAIASRGGRGSPPDREVLTIRQSIDAASLLSTDSDEARVAPLVLVVLGDDLDDHVVADLVTGLASRASGVVVAGAERDGDLAVLDRLGTVTTVDGVTGAAGRLAAVLALARAEKAPGGSYGASGSDGLLPLG